MTSYTYREKRADFDAEAVLDRKLYFAVFISKTCWNKRYYNDVLVRSMFFDLLSKYKPVHALGNCRQAGDQLGNYMVKGTDVSGPLHAFGNYKFAVVFDNRQEDGWFTERLESAVLAGTVPVYFGGRDTGNYTNSKAFVHCVLSNASLERLRAINVSTMEQAEEVLRWGISDEPGSLKAELMSCVKRVEALDRDDAKYKQMLSEPLLPHNRVAGSEFDVETVSRRVKRVLKAYDSPLLQWT